MNVNSKIAQKIKELRIQKNYTQKYISEALNISENAYSRIENGYTQLTVNNLFVIADRLQVCIISILEIEDNITINNNNNLVMNNVNHGTISIKLSPEEFQELYQNLQKNRLKT